MFSRPVAAVLAGAALALGAGACGEEEKNSGGAPDGRQLFADRCGGCHTLSAAGTSGQVGPDLDQMRPSQDRVLNAIRRGPGQMPENVATGADAQAIARFVSQNAGK